MFGSFCGTKNPWSVDPSDPRNSYPNVMIYPIHTISNIFYIHLCKLLIDLLGIAIDFTFVLFDLWLRVSFINRFQEMKTNWKIKQMQIKWSEQCNW